MSVCPWCTAENPAPATPCRRCGRLASAHPSHAAAAAAGQSKPKDFEAPDLDLPRGGKPAAPVPRDGGGVGANRGAGAGAGIDEELRRYLFSGDGTGATPSPARAAAPPSGASQPSAPRVQAAPVAFTGGGAGRVIDDPFEDSEGGTNPLTLELDLPHGSKQRAPHISAPPPQPGPVSNRPGGVAPVGAPVSHRPPSTGAAMGAPAPVPTIEEQIDREQAIALAGYGDPPRRFWETPRYAWRVRVRQNELKRELEARRSEAQQAATQLEDALVAFAERVRPVAEKQAFYLRAFDPIRVLDEQIRSMDGAAAAEMDAHKARMRDIEAKVTQVEQTLSQLQLEERRLADDLALAEATLQRAQAKLKRVEIEMRNVPSAGQMPVAPPWGPAGGQRGG